jgi:squalene cyclase
MQQTLNLIRTKYLSNEIEPISHTSWRQHQQVLKEHVWTAGALLEAEESRDSPIIREVLEVVNKHKARSGGWAATETNLRPVKGQVYDTCHVIFLFNELRINKNQVEQAKRWLVAVQNKDGGWPYLKCERSDPLCTALAIMALTEKGKKPSRSAKKGVEWLFNAQGKRGRWRTSYEVGLGRGDTFVGFSTAYAIRALLAAGIPASSERIQTAVKFMIDKQLPEGGWTILGDPDYDYPFCEKLAPLSYLSGQALSGLAKFYSVCP